ncbi:MAG: PAS domain S-box protein [Hoeflea sp.]|uniref:PAS domain S-box protein n=1 Tax=Hoeflea sp. TaxID=1940281 RepID=UPI003EF63144
MFQFDSASHPPFDVSDKAIGALFDAALDSVVGMDADGTVIAWNRQAETVFGWSREEAIGQELAELIIPAAFRDGHRDGMAHYLASGEGPVLNRRIRISAINRVGAEFPVELSIIPIVTQSRALFYGFLRDISKQQSLEQQAARDQARDKVLFEISRLAADTGEFKLLLRRSIELICTFTGAACGHIYLPEPAVNPALLRATGIWHVQSEAHAAVREHTEAMTLKLGEGLPGSVWEMGEAIWVPDLWKHSGFQRAAEFDRLGLKSGFGFPILHGEEPLAILEFFWSEIRQQDDHVLETITRIGSHLGRVIERHRAHEQADLLARELSHRVGNLMSVVSVVFQRSIRHSTSVPDVEEKFLQRLQALKSAQNRLSESDWEGTNLRQLIRDVLAPYCSVEETNCVLTGEDVTLNPSMTMTLSLVFHELAVNAAKYGALAAPDGNLDLRWTVNASDTGATLLLNWRELNGPKVSAPQRKGFGSELILRLVEKGMRGQLDTEYDVDGLTLKLRIPI